MINQERFKRFSVRQQMGNLASEISRVVYFEDKGMVKEKENSLARAIEITDVISSLGGSKGKIKEILRLKEILADKFLNGHEFKVGLKDVLDYLLLFIK